ncbi:unnamed protein product, partial [Prorocentrum cordatum]
AAAAAPEAAPPAEAPGLAAARQEGALCLLDPADFTAGSRGGGLAEDESDDELEALALREMFEDSLADFAPAVAAGRPALADYPRAPMFGKIAPQPSARHTKAAPAREPSLPPAVPRKLRSASRGRAPPPSDEQRLQKRDQLVDSILNGAGPSRSATPLRSARSRPTTPRAATPRAATPRG